jgi:predicted metal-dependent peptidase
MIKPNDQRALRRSEQALRLVCISLPWLSGLAYAVKLQVDDRVRVAAVTASGRVLVNPGLFADLPMRDAVFVLAHELLHLALDTFSRTSTFDDHETVNRAHDYIINDMLRQELRMPPPLNGLDLLGASEKSLEQIIAWMNENQSTEPQSCWRGEVGGAPREGTLSRALREAGVLPPAEQNRNPSPHTRRQELDKIDVIPADLERELFPNDPPHVLKKEDLRRVATNSLALKELARRLDIDRSREAARQGDLSLEMTALRGSYAPPWELVLQHWLEGLVPGDRSYARPSRRGADRTDCVLRGRIRIGWTLHIVLDTSGSMLDVLPRILGSITDFCEGAGVETVHLLQCGECLTADEWILVEDLSTVELIGGGNGGLTPGFERLATDPEVTAALVITDTYEEYPYIAPPFDVLWAVVSNRQFEPPYGMAILLDVETT